MLSTIPVIVAAGELKRRAVAPSAQVAQGELKLEYANLTEPQPHPYPEPSPGGAP